MTPWVLRLIIANLVVFVLQMLRPQITNEFAFVPFLILTKPWTLFTYMFLHGSVTHILFNMIGLFFFGPRLELELGSKNFLWLYFISGIAGALLSFLEYTSAIIGASGAVYGVMLGFAYFWPKDQIYVWGILPVRARTMVIVMTLLSLYGGFGGGGGIAHFAHLGGFLGGFLYLRWLQRNTRAARFQSRLEPPAPRAADVEKWRNIPRDQLHEVNRMELDRILDKINASGIQSLTSQERLFLERFSEQ